MTTLCSYSFVTHSCSSMLARQHQSSIYCNAVGSLQIYKEETFGPAVPLFKFKHDEEAIKLANDTIYGLASYFYTRVCHHAANLSKSVVVIIACCATETSAP